MLDVSATYAVTEFVIEGYVALIKNDGREVEQCEVDDVRRFMDTVMEATATEDEFDLGLQVKNLEAIESSYGCWMDQIEEVLTEVLAHERYGDMSEFLKGRIWGAFSMCKTSVWMVHVRPEREDSILTFKKPPE